MSSQRHYSPRLRDRAVRLYKSARPRPSVQVLAAELGLPPDELRSWIQRDAEAEAMHPKRGVRRATASRLLGAGRYAEVVEFADATAAESPESPDASAVLLIKLVALMNLQRVAECPAVLDTLWLNLQSPDAVPAQIGKFHALAGEVAFYQGSLQRCMAQLVRGERVMETAAADHEAMLAWMTVADVYSLVGFHKQAVAAQTSARKISESGTVEDRMFTAYPRIPVRHAVTLDQQGNQREASSVLQELTDGLGSQDVNGSEHPYLGYAIARHAVLAGGPCRPDARALLHAGAGGAPQNAEVIRLGDAALAIAEGRPGEALILLANANTVHSPLGRGEVPRLRSLAQAALGDYEAAHDSARELSRVLGEATRELYDLVISGVTDSLNYDEVQRNLRRFADEALTDSLTGLPNRRHFERYVEELVSRGGHGVVGVADLDRFKDVNTVHGHLAGDQVLEQAAGIIARSLRRGDFLARYGGDEFVLFLPGTTAADARRITDRLTAAVADYDWEHLVPGTPVTVTVGLAELNGRTGMAEAFKAADILMLEAKAASARP